jgi:rod shape-determining protein MreC
LAALSLALILIPSAVTQKARLTALAGFLPLRAAASALRNWITLPGGNDEMRRELDYYRGLAVQHVNEIEKLNAKMDQSSRLQPHVREPAIRLIPADVVIPTDGSPWRKSLTLALGTRGGARKGMLVVYGTHLVGRVTETSPWTCRVQLTIDPAFRAGAVAAPNAYTAGVSFEKRHMGVYEGTGGEKGLLKWITGDTPVEPGACVLTTEDPENGVPAGLIAGRVTGLSAGRGAYPRVDVEPMVNFRALEHVTLLEQEDKPR